MYKPLTGISKSYINITITSKENVVDMFEVLKKSLAKNDD